jgi:putative ATPase
LKFVADAADGDARRGLTLLEETASFVGDKRPITVKDVEKVRQRAMAVYDKSGEEHYNLISALHKTIRGGDPDAALYWLARMLDGGEDPMYIIRRLVRFASEDIGLADPYALTLTLNARDAYHFLGSPEGELAIAQSVIYMACAPKSNAAYMAFGLAKKDASEKGSLPVPLQIRNAPTSLMKGLGYGKNYQYAHEYEDALTSQEYFPEGLEGTRYYNPTDRGREGRLKEYVNKFRTYRREVKRQDEGEEESQKPSNR